jgi:hypothetical protein
MTKKKKQKKKEEDEKYILKQEKTTNSPCKKSDVGLAKKIGRNSLFWYFVKKCCNDRCWKITH